MDKSRHIKKEALLKALEQSLGVVTVACKNADIPRSTYYKWLNEDKEFAEAVKDIENIALDFGESKLHEQIKENSYIVYKTNAVRCNVCYGTGILRKVKKA